MKNKDWREKLRELSFMKGYYFKLEDNGLVEKKDDQLVFNREELENFISSEIEKAEERGRKEVLEKLREDFSEYGVPDDVRYTHPLFYINNIIEKRLEDLTLKD